MIRENLPASNTQAPSLLDKLRTLEPELNSRIIGQTEAIGQTCALLRRSLQGFCWPGRPLCSMLYMGPTGVGKTESVNVFTEHLFGPGKLARFDMSEYMTPDSIGLLRGERSGDLGLFERYVRDTGGAGTLLFDELEKAHRLILDIFLQILSAGRFTTSSGETLNLTNYVVVATTNIGSRMHMETRTQEREDIERRSRQAATAEMRPEFPARFNLQAVFNKLSYPHQRQIARLHAFNAMRVINQLGHEIRIEERVFEHIQSEGYSEQYGVRPMEEAAMRVLGDAVSDARLAGTERVRGCVEYDIQTNKCFLTHD